MSAAQVFSYVQLLCPVSCLLADEAYIASEAAVGRCAPDLVPFFCAGLGLSPSGLGAMDAEQRGWRALDLTLNCCGRSSGLLSYCASFLGLIVGAI